MVGMASWGALMGVQETVMGAAIVNLTHVQRRGFAYGHRMINPVGATEGGLPQLGTELLNHLRLLEDRSRVP